MFEAGTWRKSLKFVCCKSWPRHKLLQYKSCCLSAHIHRYAIADTSWYRSIYDCNDVGFTHYDAKLLQGQSHHLIGWIAVADGKRLGLNQVGEGSRDTCQQMITYCLYHEEENYQHAFTFSLWIIRKSDRAQKIKWAKMLTYDGKSIDPLPVDSQRNSFRLLLLLLFFYPTGEKSKTGGVRFLSAHNLDTLKRWCVKAFYLLRRGSHFSFCSAELRKTQERSQSHTIAMRHNIVLNLLMGFISINKFQWLPVGFEQISISGWAGPGKHKGK